ncbi:MAG: tyrosine--tRNA ligase [Candidatus Buchananbacteria bacterium RIFCSPHIGHO2_02_FULL_38_8]|uniref:Tyrosine--tRNA ligase n=1 Tax=Candidatus Buchananbacteria bacterium RIFCSPHIGHO2_02_FULL_38_8 TaxID=1797538 RepID=A0A1G1Y6A6_9BACT|nr:MAG: tyrosine--tRNA ligase [Candidatus Buchananbacteria bacterium RIFCSPHIGHO2_02_FULL_38_8]
MIARDKQKVNEALTRGVEAIYPNKQMLEKVLLSGKKLRIYNGIDPTGRLHIGHGVQLLKLRQFQDLGHEIIVLIGDFTARIGDPTDKLAARKQLTREQVTKNSADYKKLIGRILDTKKSNIRFLHNEEWTNKLKPEDMLELASYFTVQRLLERDMFEKRMKLGKEIHLHEFLYPVFQAYDSVTMGVDMEIGGNDQTFNMLAGRTLMKKMKNKEKFVLTTKLLEDPTGKKMGKTEGNMINLDDRPGEMYGKIMSWTDSMIVPAFEIATNEPLTVVSQVKKDLANGKNPKILKMLLAYSIVKMYHGTPEAIKAEEQFKQVFEQKLNPDEIKEFKVESKNIINVLVETKLASSKSEARRLINQGGIKVDTKTVKDESFQIGKIDKDGVVIQKGKRHFAKVRE